MSELNNIPKHWQVKKLGEVCQVLDNLRKPINSVERQQRIAGKRQSELYPYFGATGQVGWIDDYMTDGQYILIGEDGAPFLDIYKDKAYKISGKTWVNNHAHILKGNENVISDDFALYYLNSINYKDFVNGTTRLKLTKSSLVDIPVVLPPLPEQLAIVSKIEELLSDLENGKQQLLAAQQQLKVYRQSLLKAAFTSTTLSDRRTSSLSEAEARSHNTQNERSSSVAETKGKLKKGWKIVELSEVADMCLGKMLDKSKNKGNYQYYLRNISVRWGSFDLDNLEQMRFEKSESERFGLKKGDLVICEGGEPGRCAIWNKENSPIKIQKALHRVRVNDKLDVKFLFYFLYYSGMNGLLEKYFTGTTIKHLTGLGLKKVRIPLPPLSEQHQIVEILESKLTVCDKIEETISQSLLQAETLKQSILKKAFEGRLDYARRP